MSIFPTYTPRIFHTDGSHFDFNTRGVFGTLPNIYDEIFCLLNFSAKKNKKKKQNKNKNMFSMFPILVVWPGAKYAPVYFSCKYFPIFFFLRDYQEGEIKFTAWLKISYCHYLFCVESTRGWQSLTVICLLIGIKKNLINQELISEIKTRWILQFKFLQDSQINPLSASVALI